MSRGLKERVRERARQHYDPREQFVSMWAMLRVYKRNDALDPPGEPDYWYPAIFGGKWDRTLGAYVDGAEPEPGEVVELPCYKEGLDILLAPTRGKMRTMLLAGPGTGKTRLLSTASILDFLELPYKDTGQIGATRDRVGVMWDDLFGLVEHRAPHWIDRELTTKPDAKRPHITGVNGHRWMFRAAKEQSRLVGSPLQGLSLARAKADESQNFHDRAQRDLDERGRRAGTDFHVLESATLLGLAHQQARIIEYEDSPAREVIRLNPYMNVFVTESYWERFRGDYSDRDWRQRIMSEDVPPEHLIYHAFNKRETVRPRPRSEFVDVTREITAERWGHLFNRPQGWPWIVGNDSGTLCTVGIWLKAFRHPRKPDRIQWWACRETVSGSHSGPGDHARRLMEFCAPSDFIVYEDPGINTKDPDRSNFVLMKREGLTVVPAHHEPIVQEDRWAMFNALLRDSDGERYFFIDCDEQRTPACPNLVSSCMSLQLTEKGKADVRKVGYRDPTHWPDGAQFGMYPHERLRGHTTYELVTGYHADPQHDAELLAKAARYRERRGA